MTKEEKTLLTKVLCEQLPYEVKYKDAHGYKEVLDMWSPGFNTELKSILFGGRPSLYLRPMSSMTEEEQYQLGKLMGAASYNMIKGEWSSLEDLLEFVHKNHIDMFGLIPMGLAIAAVGYDNPYKEKGGEI